MPTKDSNGRAYARLSALKPGDTVEVDGDFTCLKAGAERRIQRSFDGGLFIACREGAHMLDGQLDDNSDALVGVYGPL